MTTLNYITLRAMSSSKESTTQKTAVNFSVNIWKMTKAELQKKLDEMEIPYHSRATVPELRDILKEARGEKPKDPMSGMSSLSSAELKKKCMELGVTTEKYTIGSMLRAMRSHYEGLPANGATAVTFGKHEGQSYEEVYHTDPQYVAWVDNEYQQYGENCDKSLQRFVKWCREQNPGMKDAKTDVKEATASNPTTKSAKPRSQPRESKIEGSKTAEEKPMSPRTWPKPPTTAEKQAATTAMNMASAMKVPDEDEDEPEMIPDGTKPTPPQWSGKPEDLPDFLLKAQMYTQLHGPIAPKHTASAAASSVSSTWSRVSMKDVETKRKDPETL